MTPALEPPARAAATAPLQPDADIGIIGGGIMGLALAYELARRDLDGARKIVVLEGRHLGWGASGRNGGGMRAQWGSPLYIELMRASIEICRDFAREIGTNIWMRQGGYLFLARSEAQCQRMQASVAVQNECGLATRLISAEEARALVPDLDVSTVLGACFNSDDAIVFPWPFLWGYAAAAARLGVAVHTQTPVTAIEPAPGGGFILATSKGRLHCARVINAAGALSPEVARLVGLPLPTWPERHEILSTEPLKPFLGPMVSVLDSGLYFSQSLRGEIVGGISQPAARDPSGGVQLGARLSFTTAMAAALVEIMPRLGRVKVVRQWAGPYDHSPDGHPIVGESATVPGFFLCCGFVGHGFMMAPIVARHYARHLTGGPSHELFRHWHPGRDMNVPSGGQDLHIG